MTTELFRDWAGPLAEPAIDTIYWYFREIPKRTDNVGVPDAEKGAAAAYAEQAAGGWAPVYVSNLSEDIPGYVEASANALAYSWKHFIGRHLGRLGTRDDVALHQRDMADIAASVRDAIDSVDPTRYFVKYGENMWAAVKGYLDEVTAVAAAPVIEQYTGVLAAATNRPSSGDSLWRSPNGLPRSAPSPYRIRGVADPRQSYEGRAGSMSQTLSVEQRVAADSDFVSVVFNGHHPERAGSTSPPTSSGTAARWELLAASKT